MCRDSRFTSCLDSLGSEQRNEMSEKQVGATVTTKKHTVVKVNWETGLWSRLSIFSFFCGKGAMKDSHYFKDCPLSLKVYDGFRGIHWKVLQEGRPGSLPSGPRVSSLGDADRAILSSLKSGCTHSTALAVVSSQGLGSGFLHMALELFPPFLSWELSQQKQASVG